MTGGADDLELWRAAGSQVRLLSQRIFVRSGGDGELLLLLHAYPTASWGFHKVWRSLCDDHKLIAPDLPGSGFSDKPVGGDFSVARLADTVEALIVQSGAKTVHVLAHAYASVVVQELLARPLDGPDRPFSIASVCFVNAGLFPDVGQPTRMQRLLLSPLGPWISRLTPHPYGIFRRRLAEAFGSDTQPSETELRIMWRLLRFNRGHVVVPDVLIYLRDRERLADRLAGALEQTNTPIGLICGAGDPMGGAEVMRVWRERLPEAPVFELDPRVGHYPPLECPQEVVAAYRSFRRSLAREVDAVRTHAIGP
jgi:pimeloyl-ACP methyl ester carboxylesterase